MPNRILKDSICTSPNIDTLSREAEVFFYRLLVQCDDYGRMDARAAILRAKCYPLQVDTVSQDNIRAWLAELVQAQLVILYRVDGGDYLQMRTWERHQQIRAKRSKYPDMITSDINCDQVITNVPVIQSNPNPIRESESESVIAHNGAETPRQPKPPASSQQDMFGAICETCELDPKVNSGKIAKIAQTLLKAEYTPEQVRGFKEWWQSDLWRFEHTPVPTIAKLTEQLQQFKNAAGKPRVISAHSNGSGQSKVEHNRQSVAIVREMLKQQGGL
jgi:hypothetical protein